MQTRQAQERQQNSLLPCKFCLTNHHQMSQKSRITTAILSGECHIPMHPTAAREWKILMLCRTLMAEGRRHSHPTHRTHFVPCAFPKLPTNLAHRAVRYLPSVKIIPGPAGQCTGARRFYVCGLLLVPYQRNSLRAPNSRAVMTRTHQTPRAAAYLQSCSYSHKGTVSKPRL